ncbi:MAG: ABC transporter substrate-binding protein [Chlorobi bacterium]|nr:ABC transporter substrate-binding protein [Chlorobiota bacterium]
MPKNTDIKILLVEDAAVMRKMEKKVLAALNYNNIIEAEDGNAAIDILAETEVDLIISDWNMPNKNGFELLVWAREQEKYKNLPFLMATGRGERKEMDKAEAAGVSSFIAKPFNAAELGKKIDVAFGVEGADEVDSENIRSHDVNKEGKVGLKIAHIQITDHLVVGVLKYLIKKGEISPKHFTLETECMSSWNPVAKALEDHTADAACILAPLSMDLANAGVPIKLISYAHKNGSIFVRNKKGDYSAPYQNFFKGKSFYIPHFLSIHHMLSHLFFTGIGLNPGMPSGDNETDINFEVVPPIQMPELLSKNQDSAGYMVAEPLGTKAIAAGTAEQQLLSSQLWEDHPCCVIVMRDEFITKFPEATFEFVKYLVQAGNLIDKQPGLAAEIAVDFLDPDKKLGLKVPILKNVLTEPLGIKTNDLFPVKEDLDKMQRYMCDCMNVGSPIDVDAFVDVRFAKKACGVDEANKKSTFDVEKAKEKALRILNAGRSKNEDDEKKTLLNSEGKYLTFSLGEQPFGIEILTVREIIKLRAMNKFPSSPKFVEGVITLRNEVVPIVNLKMKLGFPETEYDDRSVIIVLEVRQNRKTISAGVLVDAVHNVADISADQMEEAPKNLGINYTDYIIAMVKSAGKITMLLDIERVIGNDNA